jgi:Rha family phage regulatory protein
MEELILTQSQIISSKLIAEITGKQHSNVMQDIRNLIDFLGNDRGGLNFQLGYYLDANNQQRPLYELTKKEALLLASGYNPILRLKIINRVEELEINSIPKTYAQALLEAGRLALEVENKTKQIELLKPKADFYDQVTGSENCFDMADVAKVCNLGVGRNTLFQFLRDNKILRDNNTPYQQYVDSGYFRVIESKFNKPDGSININLKTVVYQKGIDFIIKRYVGRNLN